MRLWVTNGAQTASRSFKQVTIQPTYFLVKPAQGGFSQLSCSIVVFSLTTSFDFTDLRMHARTANTQAYRAARVAPTHARTSVSCQRERNSGLMHQTDFMRQQYHI